MGFLCRGSVLGSATPTVSECQPNRTHCAKHNTHLQLDPALPLSFPRAAQPWPGRNIGSHCPPRHCFWAKAVRREIWTLLTPDLTSADVQLLALSRWRGAAGLAGPVSYRPCGFVSFVVSLGTRCAPAGPNCATPARCTVVPYHLWQPSRVRQCCSLSDRLCYVSCLHPPCLRELALTERPA